MEDVGSHLLIYYFNTKKSEETHYLFIDWLRNSYVENTKELGIDTQHRSNSDKMTGVNTCVDGLQCFCFNQTCRCLSNMVYVFFLSA